MGREGKEEEDTGRAVGNVAGSSRSGQAEGFRRLAYLGLISSVSSHALGVWYIFSGKTAPRK